MESMDVINVIYQFNENYVPYAGISMTSLLVNNAGTSVVNIYALTEDISNQSRVILTEAVESLGGRISFPDTTKLLDGFKELGMMPYRGAYSVYLRLFFTEILPKEVHRVIYLDSDTIVDGNLLPLMNHDLGGRTIGMTLESITDDYKIMIGLDKSDEYFNSGVILFDADKWRINRYCERLLNHIKNVRSSYIGDQDFLNIVCKNDVCRLPVIYNFQPLHGRYTVKQYFKSFGRDPYYSMSEVEKGMVDPIIYHCYRWLGEFPWNKENLHPFNDVFDKYMSQSAWKGFVKEKSSHGIIIRIEKVLYCILSRNLFIRIFKIAHEAMLKKAEDDARDRKTNKNS